jgi:phospholipid transport system substrate-binding protein
MIDRNGSRLSRRRIVRLMMGLVALPALAAGNRGAAAASGPEAYVQSIGRDVIALANGGSKGTALRSRFVSLLNKHSDVRSIALFSLGQYQKDLPASLRSEYFRLVIEYTAGLFVYYIKDFAGARFDVKSSSPSGNATIVESAIQFSGGSTSPVKWRVVKAGGGLRVSDVNVRGIWLRLQMRQQFTSVLKNNKGDFGALLKYLKANA